MTERITRNPRGSAASKMPIHVQFSRRAILIRKVSQIDPVFGVRSGFVHARLQVFVRSGYDLCYPGTSRNTDNILTYWLAYMHSYYTIVCPHPGCATG